MTTRISLTMIVKNEERALPKCLEAARPWVDEIVVLDTGSTDRTREIARAFGAEVHEWAWRDDFAAARNESLRHATGDWVLAIDADEVLTPESGPALRVACETAPADVAAYEIKIICPREGDGGLTRLNWFPRLFRRLPGVQWEGVIHEQIFASVARFGLVKRSEMAVMHSGYTLSSEQMAAKTRRNLALLERQLREEPDYAPGWFQLAETYVLANRLDDAIGAYQRCLRLLEISRLTLGEGIIAVALQNLGAVHLQKGEREEGLHKLQAALAVDPTLATVYVHLGNQAMLDGEWAQAEEHFATALAKAADNPEREYQISPWLIHLNHGCARARQRKIAEAIESFEAGLVINPDHAEGLWLLALAAADHRDWSRALGALDRLLATGRDDAGVHVRRATALSGLGRHAEAARAAEATMARDPETPGALALLAENLARAGEPARAAEAYERLAALAGANPGPLLALAQCYEAAGHPEEALATYRRAYELAPDSADVLFALGSACLRAGALEPAAACLADAIALQPERPHFRLNYAFCLIKQERFDEARQALGDVLGRWPALSEARELGQLLARLAAPDVAAATR